MTIIDNKLNDITQRIKETLSNIEMIKESYSFSLNCETLKDYNYVDIRQSEEFKIVFEKLNNLVGPTLYWFEIKSDNTNIEIRNALESYSLKENSKLTPAMKKKFAEDSRCLYVGKVKQHVWGRIIQHLGFYKVQYTQGLQLFHWTKGLNLQLDVHFYNFDNKMIDLILIYEIELAKILEPIIGKHN